MSTVAPAAPETSPEGSSDASVAKRKGLSEPGLARAFVSPSLVVMTLIALVPLIYAVIVSFFLYQGREQIGAGVGNYLQAFSEGRLLNATIATLVFTVVSLVFEFAIGLGFALIMNQAFRGRGITRATILIPWVIPTVIAAQMWRFMFESTPGTVNYFLGLTDFNWLGSSPWAMVTIIFADVWKTAPFVALILLAGLQTIPGDVYESARVDGATAWQRLTRITLPLIRPAILVALLFRTTEALRVFDLPYIMTTGTFGTQTLSMLTHEYVVEVANPGLASTYSTLTFALVLVIGMVFVTRIGKDTVLGESR